MISYRTMICQHSWLIHAVRTRRNPLIRGVDRVEVLCLTVVLVTLVLVLWQIACVVPAVYDSRLQRIAEQKATVRSVEAQALEPIHGSVHRDGIVGRVGWTEGGVVYEATATVRRPADAGETVEIWLDSQGDVADAPSTLGEARGYTGGVILTLILGALFSGFAALAIVRWVCNHVRRRAWERAVRRSSGDDGFLGRA